MRFFLWLLILVFSKPILAQDTLACSRLSLKFSNDVFNQTDRYYTNGLAFSYSAPQIFFNSEKWSRSGWQIEEIGVFQDLYTPSVYDLNRYDPNDRPYAGVLAAHYSLQRWKPNKNVWKFHLQSGLIGEYALGEATQNGIHEVIENLEALGWSYQVNTGFLINSTLETFIPIWGSDLRKSRLSLDFCASGSLGTYKTNAGVGMMVHYGNNGIMANYFKLLPDPYTKQRSFTWHLALQSKALFVGHDATLQGALFQSNSYGLAPSQIERLVWKSELSLEMRFKNAYLGLSQFVVSPEFKNAYWHKWVSITLGRSF